MMTIKDSLLIIKQEAQNADRKAEAACLKSKYSVQDYWMCIEFRMQRLHDRIARQAGLDDRCPVFPFRQKLSIFKKHLKEEISLSLFSTTRT